MWQGFKNIYHLFVAIVANIYYGFPGKKLTVIGVTGTDGKTTTSSLIYHILHTAGLGVSLISTVSALIHGKSYDTGFHVTNPAAFPLQKFLDQTVKSGDNYLVLEVTSHGLDQNRVWGIPFAIGVLTNITHEHLDYHKTYDAYVRTKTKLLNRAGVAIINSDDSSFPYVKKYLKKDAKLLTYALNTKSDITIKGITIPKHFLGIHNTYNALAAIGVARRLGIPDTTIQKALDSFVFPPGRGQIVYNNSFTVIIDFAHTPNAFKQLLSALRPQVKGKLIHVFGSAGNRDISKRPLMGEQASEYDDVMILTSEDPRSEDPLSIMDDIEKGIIRKKHIEVHKITDRKKAIGKAISQAQAGDTIVITGKAHETSMNYGHGEEPWNEFDTVREALEKKT